MSAYETGQNSYPEPPPERWLAMYLEASAELERLRARWQPIETAPADVPLLLAYRKWADDEWVIETGYASTSNTCPPGSGASNGSAHGSATYWQPLPEPPTEAM